MSIHEKMNKEIYPDELAERIEDIFHNPTIENANKNIDEMFFTCPVIRDMNALRGIETATCRTVRCPFSKTEEHEGCFMDSNEFRDKLDRGTLNVSTEMQLGEVMLYLATYLMRWEVASGYLKKKLSRRRSPYERRPAGHS
jgi:hypothetical protein